ncbi:MAG: hypothetical protein Q8P46_15275 [Hyphomicrobiales bacterium]|nr:hypothetical protein [Hyphomicrobiales bacterium]
MIEGLIERNGRMTPLSAAPRKSADKAVEQAGESTGPSRGEHAVSGALTPPRRPLCRNRNLPMALAPADERKCDA